MLTHFGRFCTAHVQLVSSFPTHHPKKKSGLTAAILFSIFSDDVIHVPTFVGLLLQPFPIIQVAPKVEHLLSSLSARRVRLTHSVAVFDFLCHDVLILVRLIPLWVVGISAMFMYFWEVSICVCPSIFAMVVVLSPDFASSVANVWRMA